MIIIATPERQELGSYLLRRSPDNHFTYFLHYVIDSTSVSGVSEQGITEKSLKVVHILQSEETGQFSVIKKDIENSDNLQHVEECYNSIGALVKDIIGPLALKTCLHPSEYDRSPTLLICRYLL